MGLGDCRAARVGRDRHADGELPEGLSGDPKIGFFAQRDAYQDAISAGEILPPAKTMDDMHAVVTNSTVDGILAALFAILIIIVIADATRISIKAIRAGGLPTTEVAPQESHLRAPSGLFTRDTETAYEGAGRG